MRNKYRLIDIYLAGILLVAITALIFYNHYVFFHNNTNHTGMGIRAMGGGYILLAVLSLLLWRSYRGRLAMVCFVFCVIGAVEIYLLDYLNIMINYDDWIRKGQPERVFGCWLLDC